jgi:hypothetical protein
MIGAVALLVLAVCCYRSRRGKTLAEQRSTRDGLFSGESGVPVLALQPLDYGAAGPAGAVTPGAPVLAPVLPNVDPNLNTTNLAHVNAEPSHAPAAPSPLPATAAAYSAAAAPALVPEPETGAAAAAATEQPGAAPAASLFAAAQPQLTSAPVEGGAANTTAAPISDFTVM